MTVDGVVLTSTFAPKGSVPTATVIAMFTEAVPGTNGALAGSVIVDAVKTAEMPFMELVYAGVRVSGEDVLFVNTS